MGTAMEEIPRPAQSTEVAAHTHTRQGFEAWAAVATTTTPTMKKAEAAHPSVAVIKRLTDNYR